MAVFVLDKRGKPLMPCSEKRARLLLERRRARVRRLVPFSIRLVDRLVKDSVLQPVRLKIDPGSKTTGIALTRAEEPIDQETGEVERSEHVLSLIELTHRGHAIRDALTQRRTFRRRRRGKLRHRPARFDNRTKPQGWLAPSLQHRIDTTMAWVARLRRLTPIVGLAQEIVRFDTQQMQNPEIVGVEYQQGSLAGYEVREYLLEKWHRTCAYCDGKNVPLQIEHIQSRAVGGSDRVSNLTLACHACNQRKGSQPVEAFLASQPARLRRILAQAKASLRDAAAVNATRWALFDRLCETGLLVESATGGRTKWNRARLGVPKTHALDAACVGKVWDVTGWAQPGLAVKATGRGSYQRTRLTRHGFPRGYLMRQKSAFGFQTGDMVRADITTGTKVGTYRGRVAIRASGSFNIQTGTGLVQGVSHRFCKVIQRADGYAYSISKIATTEKKAGQGQPLAAALTLPGLKAGVSREAR